MKNNFITVIDETGRKSSFLVNNNKLEVIGVLPHCTKIQPANIQEANKLIKFLKEWKKSKKNLDGE